MVSTTKDGVESRYTYNVNGTRTSANATTYLVDSNRDYAQVLVESSDTDNVLYIYGDDLISQNRDNDTFFYHYDGLGSTRGLTDETGTLTDTYNYEAFGEELNRTGTTANNYLYTGEQFDSSLNQYYLRARYYNQQNGRFTQMDTWQGRSGDPITLHKYLYANVDPVNYTDPTGNFSLASFSVASNIQVQLSGLQVNVGFSILDSGLGVIGTDEAQSTQQSVRTAQNLLAIAALGAGGIALTKILAKKFYALSRADRFKKVRNGLFGSVNSVRPRSLNIIDSAKGLVTVNASNIGSLAKDVVYIYIIDESNNLIVAPRGNAKSGQKHTQLNGGGPAKAAGEIAIGQDGQARINNESGRYRAQSPGGVKRVKALFSLMGVTAEVARGAF